MTICNICSNTAKPLAKATILGKYEISYFQCTTCGFIQTEEPFWLDEAYSKAIAASDVGLVSRNLNLAKRVYAITSMCFDPNGRFLDYGGGYGFLVRLMRDYGLDFYLYDKYCANLFAQGFDVDNERGSHQYELVTAFEVFEHLPQPMVEIERMLSFSQNILFTTMLIPESSPKPGDWWYYTLDTGQHVALYSKKTLELIANRFGLHLKTDGVGLHLLTNKELPDPIFRMVSNYRVALILIRFYRRKTLLSKDYQQVLSQAFNK